MRNYPIVLLNTVLSPLSFLLVIVFVSHGGLLGEAVEGGFVMSMFSAGVGLQADLSHLKNDFKLQDMVVSSPNELDDLHVWDGHFRDRLFSSSAARAMRACILLHEFEPNRNPSVYRSAPLDVSHFGCDWFHPFNLLVRHRPKLCLLKANLNSFLNDTAGLLSDYLHSGSIQVPRIPLTNHLRGRTRPEFCWISNPVTNNYRAQLGDSGRCGFNPIPCSEEQSEMERNLMIRSVVLNVEPLKELTRHDWNKT